MAVTSAARAAAKVAGWGRRPNGEALSPSVPPTASRNPQWASTPPARAQSPEPAATAQQAGWGRSRSTGPRAGPLGTGAPEVVPTVPTPCTSHTCPTHTWAPLILRSLVLDQLSAPGALEFLEH